MRLIIHENPDEVAGWVANYVKRRILAFAPTAERPFVLGLPTGSSPEAVYKRLIEMHKCGELSFANVVTFNMDESVGLARNHPQSCHRYMWENFFKHIDINPSNVHILDGMAADLQEECDRFETRIAERGGIELLSDIGPDGRFAFNEPGSSLSSRTRIKTLAYGTIKAESRFFCNKCTAPTMTLTIGVGTVVDAREVVVIIMGAHKAVALAKCIEGNVSHMWTVSALQLHPRSTIVCDDDATLELRVKTVKYFKSIMKTSGL